MSASLNQCQPYRGWATFFAAAALGLATLAATAAFAPAAQAQTELYLRDINASAVTNLGIHGIHLQGSILYVVDDTTSGNNRMRAYNYPAGTRNTGADFTLGTLQTDPKGIWSDGTHIWVVNNFRDPGIGNFANAYTTSGTFVAAQRMRQLDEATNDNPYGIWGNNSTIWIADILDNLLYAYNKGNKNQDSGKNITLHADNGNAHGIWSDGTTMWVLDDGDKHIYAYQLSNGNRDTSKEVPVPHSGASPRGLTGGTTQGSTFLVVSFSNREIRTYSVAAKGRAYTPRIRYRANDVDEGQLIDVWVTAYNAAGMVPTGAATLLPLNAHIRYRTISGGTATAGSDFTAANSASGFDARFNPGRLARIATTNDSAIEPPETVVIELYNLQNGVFEGETSPGSSTYEQQGTSVRITVTIRDNDGATISEPAAPVTEGQNLEYVVTLAAAQATATTVVWSTAIEDHNNHASADDQADSFRDFEASRTPAGSPGDAELVFAPNQTTATVTVRTIDDMRDEEDTEVFGVLLKSVGGTSLAPFPTNCATSNIRACGFINDNDDPPFLVADDVSAREENNLEYTVRLVNAAGTGVTSEKQITGQWQVINDGTTATINSDFTVLGGGTTPIALTVRAGQSTETFSATLIDDTDSEGNETIAVQIDNLTNARFRGGATAITATGTILDNDLPGVSITADDADSSVAEGDAVVFTLTGMSIPSGGLAVPVTVSQTGRVAASGATGSRTVTIPGGSTTAKFTVATDDDNTDEDDGSIIATIGTLPATHTAGAMFSATVAVTDDEGDPGLRLPLAVNASDTDDNVVVTITLAPASGETRGAVTDKEVSMEIETPSSGTAVAGTDYTAIPATRVTFQPRSNEIKITVDIIAPDADNDDDNFYLAVRNVTNAFIFGGGCNLCIPINLLEKPTVSITSDNATISEGTTAVFTLTLTMAHTADLRVPVNISQRGRFTTITSREGVIRRGQTSVKINVPTDNDNTDEDDGRITATIGTLPDTHAGTGDSAIATVNDDDAIPILSAPATVQVSDTASEVVVTLTLRPATGAAQGPATEKQVTVPWNTDAAGTAIAGTDFVAVADTTLSFTPGVNTAQVTVELLGPDADEDVDDFELFFRLPTNASWFGAASHTTVVQIVEKPSLSITRNSEATIPESGSATFTVAITLPQSGAVVVPVTAVETGNVLGTVPPSVTIAAGQASAALNIPLDNDNRDEEDSTVTVSIALPSGSGDTYNLGVSEATLDVTDDDDAPVISFAPAEAVEGMPLQFRVNLNPSSEKTVRVNYETESASAGDTGDGMPGGGAGGGTATGGMDYTERELTTLVFLPGEVEKFIEVQTMRDDVEDPDETVILLLSLPADANATLPGFTPGMEGQPGQPVRVVGTISEGLNDDEIQALNEAILPHVAATVADETSLAISDRINAAFDGGGAAGPSAFQPYADLLRGDEQAWINTASSLANGGLQGPSFAPTDFNFTYYPGRSRAQNHSGRNHSSLPGRSRAQNHSGGPSHSGRNYSPLEGESVGQGRQPAATPVGGLNSGPPTGSPSGYALGLPTPPQGGSDSASGFIQGSGSSDSIIGDNLAIWGRGYYRDISAEKGPIAFEGDVTGFMLGADDRIGNYLLGIALNQANAEVEWDDSNFTGTHETTVAGIHPYFGWQSSSGHRLWASLGYERGELELLDDGNSNFLYKKDIALRTASLGGYGPIYEAGSISVAFVADSVYAQLEETDDSTVKIETGWLRGGVELDYDRALDDGTVFGLNAGLALRHDYGDAKEGAGVEVSGGIEYHAPVTGIRLTLDGRRLLTNETDADDWGVSGSIAWQPDITGRGLSFTFTPQWGAVNSVRDQLLAGGYARTYHSPLEGESANRGRQPDGAPVGGLNSGPPTNAAAGYALAPLTPPQGGSDVLRGRDRPQLFYTAEMKYGIPIMQQRELLVLFARTDFHGDAKNHAFGADLTIGNHFSAGVEATMYDLGNTAGIYGSGYGVGSTGSGYGTAGSNIGNALNTPHYLPGLQQADRPDNPPRPNRDVLHRAYLRYERQF